MDRVERYTYRLHVRAAIPEGIFMGVIWASADIAARNMDLGDIRQKTLAVTLITMAPGVAMFFSVFIAGMVGAIDRSRLLIGAALIGRLPLVLVFFVTDVWWFLVLLVIQAGASVPIVAAQNSLFRTNYSDSNRGRLFGKASTYSAIASGSTLLGIGLLLDGGPDRYQIVYPVVALLGLIACFIFARIQSRSEKDAVAAPPSLRALTTLRQVLIEDRNHMWFQIGFFLYGLAFMAAFTAKPIFLTENLDLSNGEILGGRAIGAVVTVLCTAVWGRVMDRIGPARLAARNFALLGLYMVVLTATTGPLMYFVSEAVFGLAMAGILICWNMGSVTLAPPGEALRYVSVHAALVGVRALIGHPLGGAMVAYSSDYTDQGPRIVFIMSAGFVLLGAWVMKRLGTHLATSREANGDVQQ